MFENTENKQLDWRIRQSFGVYTVSQSRSVVTSAENPAPDNSPQSIGELRNGHVANLQELYYDNDNDNDDNERILLPCSRYIDTSNHTHSIHHYWYHLKCSTLDKHTWQTGLEAIAYVPQYLLNKMNVKWG